MTRARIEHSAYGWRIFGVNGNLVFDHAFTRDRGYDPPWLCGGCEECREQHEERMHGDSHD